MIKLLVIALIVAASAAAVYFLVKAVKAALDKDRVLQSKQERVITQQVVALGAEELPEGIDYIFVPEYKTNQGKSRGECVIIRFNGVTYYNSVNISLWTAKDRSVESLLLSAAQRSKSEFDVDYKEYLRKKQLLDLVEGKTMLPLGETTPWKEDK